MSDNDFDPVALIKAAQAFGEVVSHAKRVAENLPKPAKKPDAPKPPEAPTQAETTTATTGSRRDILVPIVRTDARALEDIITSNPKKSPTQMAREIGNYIRSGRTDSSDVTTPAPTSATEVADLQAKLKIAEANVQRMGQERADAVNKYREYATEARAKIADLNKQIAEGNDSADAAELAELRSIVSAVKRVIGD